MPDTRSVSGVTCGRRPICESRRAQRLPGVQVETSVVPWTANGLFDNEPLGKRTAVVRADGADCEYLVATAHEDRRLAMRMSQQALAFRELRQGHALRQVRSREIC